MLRLSCREELLATRHDHAKSGRETQFKPLLTRPHEVNQSQG